LDIHVISWAPLGPEQVKYRQLITAIAVLVASSLVYFASRAPSTSSSITPVLLAPNTPPSSPAVTGNGTVPPAQATRAELQTETPPSTPAPPQFLGRIIDETGASIAGINVTAYDARTLFHQPHLVDTSSDATGLFRISPAFVGYRLRLADDTHPARDYYLQDQDFHLDNTPSTIILPSSSGSTLELHMTGARDLQQGGNLSARIRPADFTLANQQAFRAIGANLACELESRAAPDGIVVFRHVPSNVRLSLECAWRHAKLMTDHVPALAAGEHRVITVSLGDPLLLSLDFVDSVTHQPIQWDTNVEFWNRLSVRFTESSDTSTRAIQLADARSSGQFSDPIALPSPGTVVVTCNARGYEVSEVRADISTSSRLQIRLVSRRKVSVHVVDERSRDLEVRLDDLFAIGSSTRFFSGTDQLFMPRLAICSFQSTDDPPPSIDNLDRSQDQNRGVWSFVCPPKAR
jgi:hypothetical protein